MILASWFLAVNTVIVTGLWRSDPYSVGVNVAGSALLLVILGSRRPLHYAVEQIPTESLIYIHALRMWGLLLLPFSGDGLAAAWAEPVAMAEITLGMLALPLGYFAATVHSRMSLTVLWTWSVLGLACAVMAPVAAIWHSVIDNQAMQALSAYPLALVPSFFMPLMITAHVLLIRRLVQWPSPLEEANDVAS